MCERGPWNIMHQAEGSGTEFQEQLLDFLGRVKGEQIDIAAAVYYMIQKESNRADAFRFFLEHADELETTGEAEAESVFTASEIQKLSRNCGQLAEGILDHVIGKNFDEADFYAELWKRGIEENINLPEEKEKIYALYRIWTDGRIPYFKLDEGLLMTNERFREIVGEKQSQLKQVRFLLNSRFSQRTQRSSLLVRILDSCETEEEKAVILAQILLMAEYKAYKRSTDS